MMKQLLSSLVAVCLVVSAFSQVEMIEQRDLLFGMPKKEKTHWLTTDYTYLFNSNSITNAFLAKGIGGDFIDEDVKNDVSDRLKKSNRVGLELDIGGYYKYHGEKFNLVVGLRSRDHANARFNDHLFELFMRGNRPYAGQELSLTPFTLAYFNYQQLYVGAEVENDEGLLFGGGLSFLKGTRFQQLKIDRGTFFTEQDGAYIDLDIDVNYYSSDQTVGRGSAFFGAGFSGNFYVTKKNEDNGSRFTFLVKDLGMIGFKDLDHWQGDTAYHFQGLVIDNILALSDSVFADVNTDSLPAALGLVPDSTAKKTYFLPATIRASYLMRVNDKMNALFVAQYVVNATYIPKLIAQLVWRPADAFSLKANIAYGGYSNFDYGLGAAFNINDTFWLHIDANYIEPLISKKSTGQGVTAGAVLRF